MACAVERPLRIVAPRRLAHLDRREALAAHLDPCDLGQGDVLLHRQRLERRSGPELFELRAQRVDGLAQDRRQALDLALEARSDLGAQQQVERGPSGGDDPSVAVENLSARRRQGDAPQPVVLRQHAVLVAMHPLQVPEVEHEREHEQGQGDVHEQDPPLDHLPEQVVLELPALAVVHRSILPSRFVARAAGA